MGEVLGVGVSHYPPFSGKDDNMAHIVRNRMKDPGVPAEFKDPKNWPKKMQEEWGDDQGVTGAAKHRADMLRGMRKCMNAIREFNPDFCIIWGDDQYENFREDIIPPFCVMAYDDITIKPWAQAQESAEMGGKPNAWDEPADTVFPVKFAKKEAKELVSHLLQNEFDTSYAYQPLHHPGVAHAFLNAVLYLDYDREGFPWPIIPFQVNCYGSHVISYRGYVSDIGDVRELDPPAPQPKRCFDLGAEVARFVKDSPYRVALIASSSWSHAFLCDTYYRMMPDVAFDKKMYAALTANDFETWRNTSLETITETGNQEMLNWMAMVGAMNELGHKCEWADFAETYLYNSSKVAAIFR